MCFSRVLPFNQKNVPGMRQPVTLPEFVSEERERIQRRVAGFHWKKSCAWHHLSTAYGPELSQQELVSIADLICPRLNIKLDRDARRRKIVMLKWFEENWSTIQPILPLIVLESEG
jgi:hypothetical protein